MEQWIGDYRKVDERELTPEECDLILGQARHWNQRWRKRFFGTLGGLSLLFLPSVVFRNADLAAIAILPLIVVMVPVTIYLTRGVISQAKLAKKDLRDNRVEVYELSSHCLAEEDDGHAGDEGPDRIPSFVRTASGRIIEAANSSISTIPETPEPVCVAPADEQFSMVRDLTEDEEIELRGAIARASRIGQAILLTALILFFLAGDQKSLIYRSPIIIIVGIFASRLWVEHFRLRHMREALHSHLDQKQVTRIEDCEYLGNDDNRVLWSQNGIPAPWRRFSP